MYRQFNILFLVASRLGKTPERVSHGLQRLRSFSYGRFEGFHGIRSLRWKRHGWTRSLRHRDKTRNSYAIGRPTETRMGYSRRFGRSLMRRMFRGVRMSDWHVFVYLLHRSQFYEKLIYFLSALPFRLKYALTSSKRLTGKWCASSAQSFVKFSITS